MMSNYSSLSAGFRSVTRVIAANLLVGLILGCTSGSTPAPPTALTYPVTNINTTVSQSVPPDTPTVTGTVTGYSISPALPAGLNINQTTGTISGTPTAVTPTATYNVTASNAGGSTTASLQVTVGPQVVAPSSLTYTPASATGRVSIPFPGMTANYSGSSATFTVAPALPSGLTLNNTTGAITGTPLAVTASANYTVTASNFAGSTTTTIQITIAPVVDPPPAFSYASPITLETGTRVTINPNPQVNNPDLYTFSISPALPAFLTLYSGYGFIQGTPGAPSPTTTYTVTATNAGGTSSTTFQLTVKLHAPQQLSYPLVTGKVGQPYSIIPTYDGGAPTSFAISGTLPAGLSLDPTTGTISGTPTAVSSAAYTVTASNSSGSISSTVNITINP